MHPEEFAQLASAILFAMPEGDRQGVVLLKEEMTTS